jgi:hypothetical protein
MKNNRQKLIYVTISLLLINLSAFDKAIADNANPPKIISIDQVTKGPYSVGDVVTFKVNYSGGNPGIKSIEILGAGSKTTCISQSANLLGMPALGGILSVSPLRWIKNESLNNTYSGDKFLSGFVVPCQGAFNIQRVEITDETGLSDTVGVGTLSTVSLSNIMIETNPTDLITPIGEIRPKKIEDRVSLKNIPKNPKVGNKIDLPRLTQGGVPIHWKANLSCSIEYKTFLTDLGGILKFNKSGNCELMPKVMLTDKFNLPKYTANVKMRDFKDGNDVTVVGVYKVRR